MQRQQAIGVRTALVASQARVLKMALGRGLRTTIIGIVIGTAAALAATLVLQSLLFGIASTDFWTFSGAPRNGSSQTAEAARPFGGRRARKSRVYLEAADRPAQNPAASRATPILKV